VYRKLTGFISILLYLFHSGRTPPAGARKIVTAPVTPCGKAIAAIELRQETMFSPVKTTLADFDINYGEDMFTACYNGPAGEQEGGQIGGFLAAVKDFGAGKITPVPVLSAKAIPGGPVEKAVYERFKTEIVERLRNIDNLSGIYLALHGAMGVDGLYDPEGDLLKAIRDEFGASLPIGTSYDLHGNMTEKKAKLATFIVGFKTSPHRDYFDTGYTSGKILVKIIQGEVHPVMTVTKMRLLRGGGQTMDFLPPMDSIFHRIKEMEKIPGVLSISNFTVGIWTDEPDLGWSTVAVTDNDAELADKLADEIADLDWSARDYKVTQKMYTPSEAVTAARRSWLERLTGTIIFCDLCDAVGAGAPGESTWILKALVEEGPDLVSYIPLRDSQVVNELWDTPLDQTVKVSVGGKLDKVYNQPFEFTGQVIFKGNCRGGNKSAIRAVVLKHNGVHLILTELGESAYYPNFFTSIGLNLWKADIIVVKNLFPFRFWFLKYNRKTVNVVTPGITNIDVFSIKYNNLSRPVYPLDRIDSWQWKKWSTE
jgi:microcystin degradation protein MlrC